MIPIYTSLQKLSLLAYVLLIQFSFSPTVDGFLSPSSHLKLKPTSLRFRQQKYITRQKNVASEDAGFEYSRCLTPKQERDQINAELSIYDDRPKWQRILFKPLKAVTSIIQKVDIVPKRKNQKAGTLILVRCGESEFSQNHTFTGWADPDLTGLGVQEMEHAGRLLLEGGYEPDIIYTSRLQRAIRSAWIILQEISATYLPLYKSWRLNERMYGSLTGLSKKETAKTFGVDVVQAWRRSLNARPPPVKFTDKYYPGHDRKYSDLLPEQIPVGESLLDCMERVRPMWEIKISKDLSRGDNVMVVAHANCLRGLAKIIDKIGDDEITDVSFPKGIPFVYKFDKDLNPISPMDESNIQLHSSGFFLEKTGQLKKVLKQLKHLEQNVSVLSEDLEDPIPIVVKRMTTLETALMKLREEKESESRKHESHEERFEEDITPITNNEVTANVNEVNAEFDPVVVLVRHGRTSHNKLALFTGWEDPPLAQEGVEDAKEAGRLLKRHGFEFDVAYSSWLCRAIDTAWYILDEMDMLWLPVIKSWRLNERHYGSLTGKSKKMIANIYGEEQLKRWRRGYTVRPPPVSSYSFNYPGNDFRRTKYVKDLRISFTETLLRSIEQRQFDVHRKFPKCESLKDCMDRSIPFYTKKIVPEAVANGKRVLITGHENALRGILMHLCEIPEEHMNDLHLPNGVPLVYNVRRKCISLLDDESGRNPLEVHDFGSAAQYLFRPCILEEEVDYQM